AQVAEAPEEPEMITCRFAGEKGANAFSFPKSIHATGDCLKVCGINEDGTALDYFAGSGTTGHSVINLNREDGGSRKFILVEMEQYFDTVLLPRIKKVTFTPEWEDGKAKRLATAEEAERSPRLIKVIRLESYEDALDNIVFDDASGQRALGFEDYLIKYMLKWETRASETLLNVEKLSRPFSYKFYSHADGQTRERVADIPETFNYLLGLHVQTRRVYDDDLPVRGTQTGGRRCLVYRGWIDHRQVAVIWRETQDWTKEDLERDKKFVAEQKMIEGADEIFVNGDSFIPDARALEPLFKARMFAEVDT
ncbi:MAG: DNA methyltransferase, partial [Candidatus Eisenbacteria bacterium]